MVSHLQINYLYRYVDNINDNEYVCKPFNRIEDDFYQLQRGTSSLQLPEKVTKQKLRKWQLIYYWIIKTQFNFKLFVFEVQINDFFMMY
jgi:hypothetical protein